jgi:hypothetical protein
MDHLRLRFIRMCGWFEMPAAVVIGRIWLRLPEVMVGGTYAKDLKGSLVSLRIAVLEEVVPLLAD